MSDEFFQLHPFSISQSEWERPELNEENILEQENIWNWANVFWVAVGSNLGAGCEILPR